MMRALITGITGQDGSYLAKLLLEKGYEVHGLSRELTKTHWRHNYLEISNHIKLHQCDLMSYEDVENCISSIQPDKIFHLAAQSSIPESLRFPIETIQFNITSTQNLLEAIRQIKPEVRFFHASSSEIFDQTGEVPFTIHSAIKPSNPYGISKATCHFLTITYRKQFQLYAVNGVLFPHESPLRDRPTLLTLFVSQAEAIKNGDSQALRLAAPENIRDIGDARSYVEAISLSLEPDEPSDYIISSGKPVSIRSVAMTVLEKYNLNESYIVIDNSLLNTTVSPAIYGDLTETTRMLNWLPSITLSETIESIIKFKQTEHHAA